MFHAHVQNEESRGCRRHVSKHSNDVESRRRQLFFEKLQHATPLEFLPQRCNSEAEDDENREEHHKGADDGRVDEGATLE